MSNAEQQRAVLEAMGLALLMTQSAERVIRLCLTLVIQKQSPVTLELLQQQEASECKKTIGYFLAELRKRAAISDEFDTLLAEFLQNRNDFVHDLSRVPSWDLSDAERTTGAMSFVRTLIRQADEVTRVFAGLILAWQEQTGLTDPKPPMNEWFREVGAHYKPLADDIFGSKAN